MRTDHSDAMMGADPMMETDTSGQMMTQDNRTMMTPPAVEREGYVTAQVDDLTADDLTGARVYGPNDEDVARSASCY